MDGAERTLDCVYAQRSGRVLRALGPIRLRVNHDFTVRCIRVESIARGRWMVPLKPAAYMLSLRGQWIKDGNYYYVWLDEWQMPVLH